MEFLHSLTSPLTPYNSSSKAFSASGGSNQFIINSSTLIIQVPEDRSNGEDFKKRSYSGYFKGGMSYVVEPYDIDGKIAKVVLVYGGDTGVSIPYSANVAFVEDIRDKLVDGETVKQLTYYLAGETTAKTILTEKANTLDGISTGDLVRLAIEDDELVRVQKVFVNDVLYDWSADNDNNPTEEETFNTFAADGNIISHGPSTDAKYYQVVLGTIDSIASDSGSVSIVPVVIESEDDEYDDSGWISYTVSSSTKVYALNDDGKFETGKTIDDVTTVEEATSAFGADTVVIIKLGSTTKAVYILD